MVTTTPERLFGASVTRREDARFITGAGQYTDDVTLPGTVYASFVRSPYAHARIRGIDTSTARAMPGVHAVYTGKDLSTSGVNPIPPGWLIPDMKIAAHHPLAIDAARYVGDAVAVVIADSPYLAKDAAEAVEVDYEELPAVANAVKALESGAPQLHDNAPGNLCFHWSLGDQAASDGSAN